MKILVDCFDTDYLHRVDYVLDFINEHPLNSDKVVFSSKLEEYDVKISYGGVATQDQLHIPAQEIIFSNNVILTRSLVANEYSWNGNNLYSVEDKSKSPTKFLESRVFQFDIIENIFFHLSRYEEYHCDSSQLDRWDMMKEENQFLVKHKLEKTPVVDTLVFCFLDTLGLKPKAIKTKIRITHDIDLIKKFKSILSFARFNLYYIKNWKGIKPIEELWKSYYRATAKKEKAYDVFEEMLLKNDFDKEIYFLIGGKASVDTPLDTDSDIFKKAISLSKERGYAIGIHPSYNTWKNSQMLLEEKTRLEEIIDQEIVISRQHYLHFSFADTIEILELAGIQQDSTIGYNRIIGFRAGTGVAFKLFDFKNERVSSITEKPLVFMDSSLFDEAKCQPKKFLNIASQFFEDNKIGTEITCNFHNSRFDDAKMFGLPLGLVYKNMING